MRRVVALVFPLVAVLFVLATTVGAVPLLVELKIRDPLAAHGPEGDDVSILPSEIGNGRGGENGKGHGKPGDPLSKSDLKGLKLWLSTDGKSWKELDGEITALTGETIKARFQAKGDGSPIDLATSFGLPTGDITGSDLDSYFIGISTGSTSGSGPTLTAHLVSWQYFTRDQGGSVPAPGVWSLVAAGALGMALALRARRKP